MFHTLRSRLILSHLLPLLVVVPLMGIALIYLLEETVLLPNLTISLKHRLPCWPIWRRANQTSGWMQPLHKLLSSKLGHRSPPA